MNYAELKPSEVRTHLKENTDTIEQVKIVQQVKALLDEGSVVHPNLVLAKDTAQQLLLKSHVGFIKKYAAKHLVAANKSSTSDFEDTLQEATLGFLRAVDKYQPEREAPLNVFAHYMMTETLHLHVAETSSRPDPFRNKVNKGLRDIIIGHKKKGMEMMKSYELMIEQSDESISAAIILSCVKAVYEQFSVTVADDISEEEILASSYVSSALRPAEETHNENTMIECVRAATLETLKSVPNVVRVAYLFKRGFDTELKPLKTDGNVTNKQIANILHENGMTGDDGRSALTSEAIRMMFKRIDASIQETLAANYNIKHFDEVA